MKTKIEMPRLGVNDDLVFLARWEVADGDEVSKGQTIADIETTKETSEIAASVAGRIKKLVDEGQDVKVGDIIAVISDDREGVMNTVAEVEHDAEASALRMTRKARELCEKNGIDVSAFPPGVLIREKDVLKLLENKRKVKEIKQNSVLIYGGGGFGKIAVDILKKQSQYDILGIIDSNYPDKKEVLSIPVIGNDAALERYFAAGCKLIINCVGFLHKGHWRKAPYIKLGKYGFQFINVIHSAAMIEQSAKIGKGNLICAGAIIGSEAIIGDNCIINAGAIISHDCSIHDSCHIASGAVLAGNVTVGENTLIGQNCTIYSDVVIGKNVVIQNGCHVFKDVGDNEIVTNI